MDAGGKAGTFVVRSNGKRFTSTRVTGQGRGVMSLTSSPAGWESRRSLSVIEHLTKTFIGRGELALASGVFLVGQRTMSSKLTPRAGRALRCLRRAQDGLPKHTDMGAAL